MGEISTFEYISPLGSNHSLVGRNVSGSLTGLLIFVFNLLLSLSCQPGCSCTVARRTAWPPARTTVRRPQTPKRQYYSESSKNKVAQLFFS